MMRKFIVNVNGTSYEVEVEEIDGSAAKNVSAAPAAPAAAPASAAPAAGGKTVVSPMPGNILDVKVNVGDTVSVGQVLVVLEALKMENDIVANAAGKITSLTVKKGDTVNSDDVIATIA